MAAICYYQSSFYLQTKDYRLYTCMVFQVLFAYLNRQKKYEKSFMYDMDLVNRLHCKYCTYPSVRFS